MESVRPWLIVISGILSVVCRSIVAYAMPTLRGFVAAAGAPSVLPSDVRSIDAAFDDVFGLALGPRQLHAVHAAVARVHELQVVDESPEETGPRLRHRDRRGSSEAESIARCPFDRRGRSVAAPEEAAPPPAGAGSECERHAREESNNREKNENSRTRT